MPTPYWPASGSSTPISSVSFLRKAWGVIAIGGQLYRVMRDVVGIRGSPAHEHPRRAAIVTAKDAARPLCPCVHDVRIVGVDGDRDHVEIHDTRRLRPGGSAVGRLVGALARGRGREPVVVKRPLPNVGARQHGLWIGRVNRERADLPERARLAARLPRRAAIIAAVDTVGGGGVDDVGARGGDLHRVSVLFQRAFPAVPTVDAAEDAAGRGGEDQARPRSRHRHAEDFVATDQLLPRRAAVRRAVQPDTGARVDGVGLRRVDRQRGNCVGGNARDRGPAAAAVFAPHHRAVLGPGVHHVWTRDAECESPHGRWTLVDLPPGFAAILGPRDVTVQVAYEHELRVCGVNGDGVAVCSSREGLVGEDRRQPSPPSSLRQTPIALTFTARNAISGSLGAKAISLMWPPGRAPTIAISGSGTPVTGPGGAGVSVPSLSSSQPTTAAAASPSAPSAPPSAGSVWRCVAGQCLAGMAPSRLGKLLRIGAQDARCVRRPCPPPSPATRPEPRSETPIRGAVRRRCAATAPSSGPPDPRSSRPDP